MLGTLLEIVSGIYLKDIQLMHVIKQDMYLLDFTNLMVNKGLILIRVALMFLDLLLLLFIGILILPLLINLIGLPILPRLTISKVLMILLLLKLTKSYPLLLNRNDYLSEIKRLIYTLSSLLKLIYSI